MHFRQSSAMLSLRGECVDKFSARDVLTTVARVIIFDLCKTKYVKFFTPHRTMRAGMMFVVVK